MALYIEGISEYDAKQIIDHIKTCYPRATMKLIDRRGNAEAVK